MALSILMNTGKNALLANQVALDVTGNNIANVNTEGYSRQSVRFDEIKPLDRNPGQIGLGAYVSEIYRNFNRFLENAYLERFTDQQRWSEQATVMGSVENVFNEANRDGIASQLSAFFTAWNTLAANPENRAAREALLAQAENLAHVLGDTRGALESMQSEMDDYIEQGVEEVNAILDEIAAINKEIDRVETAVNTPNTLYDNRDQLVRKLASLIDIKVQDNGKGDFAIFTEAGQPLIHDQSVFKFVIQGPRVEKQTESFMGELVFSGSDSHEYTLEFVDDKNFRVSLDGGRSWLRDENGQISTFEVPGEGQSITVKSLEISFDYTGDAAGDTFHAGDKFSIMPKTGIYWDSPTRDPINVTPQIMSDGTEDSSRLTGGKLPAYFNVRDDGIGAYIDKLDALAKSLIWEVNRLHSQGSGLSAMTDIQGTYSVADTGLPLGTMVSGLTFGQKLTDGSMTLHFYDENGDLIPSATGNAWILDFGNNENFDPQTHSLQDVVDALNNLKGQGGKQMLTATIEGGTLHITAEDGVSFKMGTDNTGLLAALGLNTFFQGSSAYDISLNPLLERNTDYVNAHGVDGQDAEGNVGDGIIAARIAQLATKEVTITTMWENTTCSLGDYYAGLVGLVGADAANANFNNEYNTSLADELESQVSAISGVNLDEELTNLIRFQHSYTAAAKLITTADQMLETILGLKQ